MSRKIEKKEGRTEELLRKRELTSEEIAKLPVEEAALYILSLPPEKRLDILEELDNAKEIVQFFPPQEVFYTIKESDEDKVRYLLPLLNKEQFIFLLDIDLWEKDKLSQPKIKLWLDRIADQPLEEITRRIKEMDPELVETIIKRTMYVKLKPSQHEMDIMEAMDKLPPYTLDGVFYFNFQNPEIKAYMEKILTALYSQDIEYVLALLLESTATTLSEVEELSYQFKTARLKDYMIPDLDEAIDIYQPLPDDILKELESKKKEKKKVSSSIVYYDEPEIKFVKTTFSLCKREEPYLAKIFERITDGVQINRIVVELTRCMYKTLVADLKPIDDINAHRESARKVSYHINLALKLLTDSEEEARQLILKTHLSYLVRYANQIINRYYLKAWRIKKGSWLGEHPKAESLIDLPWNDVLKAITYFRPYYPASVWNEGKDRPFRDPEDLEKVNRVLDLIELMGEILKKFVGITPKQIFEEYNFKETYHGDSKFADVGLFFRTGISNWFIKGRVSPEPIDPKDIKELANIIWSKDRDSLIEEIIEEIKKKSDLMREDKIKLIREYGLENIKILREELEGIRGIIEIDPRYISSILVKREV